MKTNKLSKLLIFALIIVGALGFMNGNSYAAGGVKITFDETAPPGGKLLETTKEYETIQVWHSSGGVWTESVNNARIPDAVLEGDINNLQTKVVGAGYPIDITFPASVKKAINEGKNVTVQIQTDKAYTEIGKMFNYIDQPEKHKITQTANGLRMMTFPIFNYEIDSDTGDIITYWDHNFKIKTQIPFVKHAYGYNGYSLYYKNKPRPSSEWASYSAYLETEANKVITLDMMDKTTGALKPGYSIKTRLNGADFYVNSSDIKIGQGTFENAGALGLSFNYPLKLNFYIEGDKKSDMILTKLELIDPDTGVIEEFKREVDNINPFDAAKEKLTRTSLDPKNASGLKADVKYTIRAEYQYISFEEGAFDISKPTLMTPEQRALSTGVNRNNLDTFYSYDGNALRSGAFDDTGVESSNNKPVMALKNLEKATFEWEYQLPATAKQYVKIAGKLPVDFSGFDKNTGNDWGVVFGRVADGVDIGMAPPIKLIESRREVKFLDPTSDYHQVIFDVAHYMGEDTVGLHPTTNPKVRVDIEVKDAKGNSIMSEIVQATVNLEKGKTITMPISSNFSGRSGEVTVCGTINSIHKSLGYNADTSNDTICATFMVAKNYAVNNVKLTPPMIYLDDTSNSITTPLEMTFDLVNESSTETGSLSERPLVRVKRENKVVWEGTKQSIKGSTINHTIVIPPATYGPGNHKFSIEVNPDRTEVEFKPGVANPYLDNIGNASLTTKAYEICADCVNVRTSNTWTERFSFREVKGNVRWATATDSKCFKTCYKDKTRKDGTTYKSSYCCDRRYKDYQYSYCSTYSDKSWNTDKNYYERYGIQNIFFKSKWSVDNHGGWVDLKNMTGKIKAGYGFELKITTKYETDRHSLPGPDPYSSNYSPSVSKPFGGTRSGGGYCDWLTRSPGISPVNSPTIIYVGMPFTDKSGNNVCYKMDYTGSSGSWYNNTKTFELPRRLSFGNQWERKIYVNEDAKPNTSYIINVETPDWYGYSPNSPTNLSNKRLMCDESVGRIEILAQDDIKSHIVQ